MRVCHGCERYFHLDRDAVQSGRYLPTFRIEILRHSLGEKYTSHRKTRFR